MKTFELYTEDDAVNDVTNGERSGREASILKWQMIVDAYEEIYNEMCSPCGLCVMHHEDCSNCDITTHTGEKCTTMTSPYGRSWQTLDAATKAAQKMLQMLEALPK